VGEAGRGNFDFDKVGNDNMKHFATPLFICALVSLAFASPRVEVHRGNQAAKSGDAAQAFTRYKRALDENGDSTVIFYDVGNLLYGQGEFEKAGQAYLGSVARERSAEEQSATLYNLGNALFEQQQYDQAVAAYIESLKRNPSDVSAKYNLELARRMLQQQQQQQQQNQDQKQDEKQDQQDQQQQNQQQEQDQQQQEEPQQEQQQQQMPRQMTQEEAERLLDALLQDEQKALHDAKKVKVATRPKREKDW